MNEIVETPSPWWVAVLTALVIPPVLAMMFLGTWHWLNDTYPVDGYVLASRDKWMFRGFGLVLAAFVVAGGLVLRRGRRVVFVSTAIPVSVFTWLLTFVSQIAG
jgi:hypothetical protein